MCVSVERVTEICLEKAICLTWKDIYDYVRRKKMKRGTSISSSNQSTGL